MDFLTNSAHKEHDILSFLPKKTSKNNNRFVEPHPRHVYPTDYTAKRKMSVMRVVKM